MSDDQQKNPQWVNTNLDPATIAHLSDRITHAAQHHGPANSDDAALGAIYREVYEVTVAMQERNPERVRLELLDVAVVAIRRAQAISAVLDQEAPKPREHCADTISRNKTPYKPF